ncbi:MAG: YihY/virulence factor BrkB family protein [Kiritimatiellaeota bacterium]|nr:YihY/virulence factor BrkB family protein [Kiritimatiellota bacterium]
MGKIGKLLNYLKYDIWRVKLVSLPKKISLLVKQLRMLLLTFKGFVEDNCVLRASSLTFFTLLSIVPIFAMGFGIAKGFGLDKNLEAQLKTAFSGQQEILNRILEFSHNQLERTGGGMVAGLGVLLLFWTILKLLGNMENALNEIWGIKRGRNLGRKMMEYAIIIFIAPLLLIMSQGVTAFLSAEATLGLEKIELLRFIGPYFHLSLKLIPLVFLWALFTFLYIFMPNTKVNFWSGVFAGFIAALLSIIVQFAYFRFQVKIFTQYSAIYGSFAAMPLFLVWLEVSWMIFLLGAEISFSHQNVDTFEFDHDVKNTSPKFRRELQLFMASVIAQRFESGGPPVSLNEFTDDFAMPYRLAKLILNDLVKAGIVMSVVGNGIVEEDECYQPAVTTRMLTVEHVLEELDSVGVDDIPFAKDERFKQVTDILERLRQNNRKSKQNVSLADI